MTAAHYAPRSIEFYVRELRFLFEYYPQLSPTEITEAHITQYMCYVKDVLQCGRDKCRGVAQSFSFMWKHVLKQPFILPSKLYPRKQFKLPEVMSQDEVKQLLRTPASLKSRTILCFFYSTGMRVNEVTHVKFSDIDRANMRIKVTHGKGDKERFTLLSPVLLQYLEAYYRKFKPVDYIFNGNIKGKKMGDRAMQYIMHKAISKLGLNVQYSLHSLRHSFATHLLDQGCNIHNIKELLGHSHLQSTMIYLHLQTHVRQQIVSPLDTLAKQQSTAKQ